MQRTKLFAALTAAAFALGLAACSSTPGPVQPDVGPKPPGVLYLDPSIASYLDVPNGQQNYSYNALGFLEYNTQVRNKGTKTMTLSVNADFYDDQNRLTESKSPERFFIDPNMIKPLQIAANSKDSKRMEIQIRPTK